MPNKSDNWNTDKNYGPQAQAARAAIRERFNSPASFSVPNKRWQPRMNTNQGHAMRLLIKAYPDTPFYHTDGRTLRSLRSRGWVEERLPRLTALGVEVAEEFLP